MKVERRSAKERCEVCGKKVKHLQASNRPQYLAVLERLAMDIIRHIASGDIRGKGTIVRMAKVMATADST